VTIAVDVGPHAVSIQEASAVDRHAALSGAFARAAVVVISPDENCTQEANGQGGVRCVPHAAVTRSRKDLSGTTHSARRLCHDIWPVGEEAG
jgi:hypothetical protein